MIDENESQVLEQILHKTDDEVSEKDKKSQIWLHYERLRQSIYWLPASAGAPNDVSMEDIEDLERVVLSDEDIKPWLFRLRLCESKWYLVKGFLEYLGVQLVTFALDSAGSTSRFEVEVSEVFWVNKKLILFCFLRQRRNRTNQMSFFKAPHQIQNFLSVAFLLLEVVDLNLLLK